MSTVQAENYLDSESNRTYFHYFFQRVVKFDVYHDLNNICSLERVPSCAPIVNYSVGKDR